MRLYGLRALWHRWCARGWRQKQRDEMAFAREAQDAAARAALSALRHERRAEALERAIEQLAI